MRRLSDFKDEAALELWGDLLEPLSDILTNDVVRDVVGSGASKIKIAQTIIKECPDRIKEALLIIDPTPLNGFNLVMRLVSLITEIGSDPDVKAFFGFAERVQTKNESSGFVTENTEDEEE